jgi:hypothetical protein
LFSIGGESSFENIHYFFSWIKKTASKTGLNVEKNTFFTPSPASQNISSTHSILILKAAFGWSPFIIATLTKYFLKPVK